MILSLKNATNASISVGVSVIFLPKSWMRIATTQAFPAFKVTVGLDCELREVLFHCFICAFHWYLPLVWISLRLNDKRVPAKTSPVSAYDVARVVATILENPKGHAGKVYELTGSRSQDMEAIAREYEEALGQTVKYVDVPFGEWISEFESRRLPPHVAHHILTMAKLHADGRYDRFTTDVEKVTGTPSMSIGDYVKKHPALFAVDEIRKKGNVFVSVRPSK